MKEFKKFLMSVIADFTCFTKLKLIKVAQYGPSDN